MQDKDYNGHLPAVEQQPFEFQTEEDGTLSLEAAVYQAIGAASVCWDDVPHGLFNSDRAKTIAEALMQRIGGGDRPRLDAMSDRELSEETVTTLRQFADGLAQFNEHAHTNPMMKNLLGL